MQRVATHVVFQQVAQVLRRDVQVSGPLQTRLGPHTIHLVLSDTLCMVVVEGISKMIQFRLTTNVWQMVTICCYIDTTLIVTQSH